MVWLSTLLKWQQSQKESSSSHELWSTEILQSTLVLAFFYLLFCTGVEPINKQWGHSFRWTVNGLSPTYTCIHSPQLPSHPGCPITSSRLPALHSGILLALHFKHRQWHPTPVLLPGKSQGWRSLVGCSPWGREESDTTEQLHFHFSLLCIGEGKGNPLQCSCLENPRDGGAWWAAVYGVAQSRTRLKRLSSSSNAKYTAS